VRLYSRSTPSPDFIYWPNGSGATGRLPLPYPKVSLCSYGDVPIWEQSSEKASNSSNIHEGQQGVVFLCILGTTPSDYLPSRAIQSHS